MKSKYSVDLSRYSKEDLDQYMNSIIDKVAENVEVENILEYLFMYWNSGGSPVLQFFGLDENGEWQVVPLAFDMSLLRLTGELYKYIKPDRIFAYSIYIDKNRNKDFRIFDNLNPLLGWENLYLVAYEEYGIELPILPYHNVTIEELKGKESFKDTLFYSIYHRDKMKVKEKINDVTSEDVDLRIRGLGTPLTIATKNGDLEIVKIIVESGADINKTDAMGYTPLMYSIENGFEDISLYLLDKGADVNLSSLESSNPLEMAILVNSSLEIKEKVIENGFDINKKGFEEMDLMSLAVLKRDMDSIDLLLENNIDEKYITKAHELALLEESEFAEIANYLSKHKA